MRSPSTSFSSAVRLSSPWRKPAFFRTYKRLISDKFNTPSSLLAGAKAQAPVGNEKSHQYSYILSYLSNGEKLEFHGEGAERAPETFCPLIADEIGSAGSIGSKRGRCPKGDYMLPSGIAPAEPSPPIEPAPPLSQIIKGAARPLGLTPLSKYPLRDLFPAPDRDPCQPKV